MPTVFQTHDRLGRPHARWRFKYRDHEGVRRTATGTDSKRETEKLAIQVQAREEAIRRGWAPRPKSSDLPREFTQVVEEYLSWGRAQGGHHGRPWSPKHAARRKAILEWWRQKLGLEHLHELDGILPEVERALRELKEKGLKGKSLQSQAEALAALCDWCQKREYLDKDPLQRLGKFDTTPKMVRRALTLEEIHRLLAVSPPDRRLIYFVALATALRANELRSLRVHDLDLENGGLRLDASWTKNRRRDFQPLPVKLLDELREAVHGRQPEDRLLRLPRDAAGMLYKDLAKAGIPKVTAEGRVDFHALRVTAQTLADENGATVKQAQEFARHSAPTVTYDRYIKARRERLAALTERIGEQLLGPADGPTVVEQPSSAEGSGLVSQGGTGGNGDAEEETGEGPNPTRVPAASRSDDGHLSAKSGQQQGVTAEGARTPGTNCGQDGTNHGHEMCPTEVQRESVPAELQSALDALPLKHRQVLLRYLLPQQEERAMATGFIGFTNVALPTCQMIGFSGFSAAARSPQSPATSGFSGAA